MDALLVIATICGLSGAPQCQEHQKLVAKCQKELIECYEKKPVILNDAKSWVGPLKDCVLTRANKVISGRYEGTEN